MWKNGGSYKLGKGWKRVRFEWVSFVRVKSGEFWCGSIQYSYSRYWSTFCTRLVKIDYQLGLSTGLCVTLGFDDKNRFLILVSVKHYQISLLVRCEKNGGSCKLGKGWTRVCFEWVSFGTGQSRPVLVWVNPAFIFSVPIHFLHTPC